MSYSDKLCAHEIKRNSNLYDFFCSRFETKSENCRHDEKTDDEALDHSLETAMNKMFEGTPFHVSTENDDT